MKTFFKFIFGFLILTIWASAVAYVFYPEQTGLILSTVFSPPSLSRGDSAQGDGEVLSAYSGVVDAIPMSTVTDIASAFIQGVKRQEGTINIPTFVPANESDGDEYFLNQLEQAITLLRQEYPEVFWLGLAEGSILWGRNRDFSELVVGLDYSYSPAQIIRMQSQMDTVIDSVLEQMPEDSYKAVKYIHDWIVDNTVYDMEAYESEDLAVYDHAYNINGVFLDGTAVCEGYAKAFKVLCDRAGIPCRIVFGEQTGERHAWNYVYLNGGWYLVDATYDDPVSDRDMLVWDYFLVGAETVVDGVPIYESYVNDVGDYPTLSRTAYYPFYGSEPLPVAEEPPQEDGAATPVQRIQRVQMKLTGILEEGTANVGTGSVVGVITGYGYADHFSYMLTGDGRNDHLFMLDSETGELFVQSSALAMGNYQIIVKVSAEEEDAVVEINFSVGASRSSAAEKVVPPEDRPEVGTPSSQEEFRPIQPRWIA